MGALKPHAIFLCPGADRKCSWRAKLPSWSAATPIIWGDMIFVTSAEEGFFPWGSKRGATQATTRSFSSR